MLTREKSQNGLPPLSGEETREAEDNLVRCLDALDQKGEAGLEEELKRIHPDPGHERVPIFNGDSFARKLSPAERAQVNSARSISSSPTAKTARPA